MKNLAFSFSLKASRFIVALLCLVAASVCTAAEGPAWKAAAAATDIVSPTQVGVYKDGHWRLDFDGNGQFEFFKDRNFGLGFPGAQQFVADWNGDGFDEVGVFSAGYWFIDYNGDGQWDGGVNDLFFSFGWAGATPVVGDWNGDGAADVGVYSLGFWFLDYNGDRAWDGGIVDKQFPFGWDGVTPLVGDWDGDGRDQVGVYNLGFWFLDYDGDTLYDGGSVDRVFGWGWPGVTLVVGDWDGDGRDQAGVYSEGFWFLDYDGDASWDGGTNDRIVGLGWTGAIPVVGDWNGNGSDKVGVYSVGNWFLDRNGTGMWEPESDAVYSFGEDGDTPAVGVWAPTTASGTFLMNPAPGSTGVPRDRRIVLTAPEPVSAASVDEDSVRVLRGGVPVAVTRRVSADGRYISIEGGLLVGNSEVEVIVDGVTTAYGALITPPLQATLRSSSSSLGTRLSLKDTFTRSSVPTNAVFHLQFTTPIDPATWEEWLLVRQIDGKERSVDCELDTTWTVVTCTPTSPLDVGTRFEFRAPNLRNIYSHRIDSTIWFTTGFGPDLTPPAVLGVLPANGSSHEVGEPFIVFFDEPIRLGPGARVEVSHQGTSIDTYPSQYGSGGNLEIGHGTLQAGNEYDLTVEGVENYAGLSMDGAVQLKFTAVGNTYSNSARWKNPGYNDEDVPVKTSVYVDYQTPLVAASVTPETAFLSGPGGRVPAQVSLLMAGRRLVIDPLADLLPYSTYTVTITYDVRHISGDTAGETWPFQTGMAVDDDVPPQIVSVWPQNGAVGVNLLTTVVLEANEDLAVGSINEATVRLSRPDGWNLDYKLKLNPAHILELGPSYYPGFRLDPNTTYTLRIDGVTDLAGNPLPALLTTFRTGVEAPTGPPTLVSMTPTNGSSGVGLEPTVELLFSEPLRPPSIGEESTSLYLVESGLTVPGAVSLVDSGRRIRIIPSIPLLPMTEYGIKSAALDYHGNPVPVSTLRFTTGAGPGDTTPPTVLGLSIPDGARIPPVGKVRFDVLFSEPIDPATANLDTIILLVNGKINRAWPESRSDHNQTLTYALAVPYQEADVSFQVIVTAAVKDISGNQLESEFSQRFVVERGPAIQGELSIEGMRPEGRLAVDGSITLLLDQPIRTDNLTQTLFVSEEGILIDGQFEALAEDRALRFTPLQPLEPGALVQVFMRPELTSAINGTSIRNPEPRQFWVDSASPSQPFAVEAFGPDGTCCSDMPVNGRWMARMNRPVNPATVNVDSVRLEAFDGAATGSLQVLGGDTIVFTPTDPLVLNRYYRLKLSSLLEDLEGNQLTAIDGPSVQVRQALDETSPEILATTPPGGLADVPRNATIRVLFSETIEALTVREESFSVVCGGQPLLVSSHSVPYSQDFAELKLAELLPPNEACVVSLDGATDRAGLPVPPASWGFQTAAGILSSAPGYPVIRPAGPNVGINALPTLTFDQPMDPTSYNPETLALSTEGVSVPGEFSWTADGRSLVFTPDAPLGVGQDYSWSTASITNLIGKWTSTSNGWFTTGFAPDFDPPFVATSSIADRATNVSPFGEFTVEMNEPIDRDSVTSESVQILDGASSVPLSLMLDYDNQTLLFNPLTALELDRAYTIRIAGLEDMLGNVMTAPFLLNFSTRPAYDFIRPTGYSNISGAKNLFRNVAAKIRFSEPMDPATIRPDTMYFQVAETYLPTAVSLDASGTVATLTPVNPLPANSDLRVMVTGLATDLSGNPLDDGSNGILAFFQTGSELTDSENPRIDWPAWLATVTVPTNFSWWYGVGEPSESLDPWSYSGDLVELVDAGGNVIPRGVTLNPSSSYTFRVKDAVDFAGNPLVVSEPPTFVTGAGPLTSYLPYPVHNPSSEALGVPLETAITATYTTPVRFLAVQLFEWYSSSPPTTAVPMTYVQSADWRTVTIVPDEPLSPNTLYIVALNAVGLSGYGHSSGNYGYDFRFTTGSAAIPDTEPPTLVSMNPPDGATDVTNPEVSLTFSEPLHPQSIGGSVAVYVDGALLYVGASRSSDGATIRVHAGSPPDGAEIAVVVTEGLTDVAGNPATPMISRFTYASPAPADQPAQVRSVRPPSGASEVERGGDIYVFFSRPIDPTTIPAAVLVSENGVLVTGQTTVSSNDQVVRFRSDNDYQSNARIRLFVDLSVVRGTDGLPLGDWIYKSTYVTEGAPLPAQVAIKGSPLAKAPLNSHIVVDFDRPMDPSTFSLSSMTLSPAQPYAFSLENGNRRLRVVTDDLLPANRSISLQLRNTIRAVDGTALSGSSSSRHYFGTGSQVVEQPTLVSSVSPPDGATGVGVNASINLIFSGGVNLLTINESTVRWTDGSGDSVHCMIEFADLDGKTVVRITPHDPFTPQETYQLTIEGVEDLVGQAIPTSTSLFTAGNGPDFIGPKRIRVEPPDEGTVARNAVISMTFDEPISSSTVTPATIGLRHRLPDYAWADDAADVTLSPDGLTIFISPTILMEPNSLYRVDVTQQVGDVSGNPVSIPISPAHTFNTGVTNDLTPPQLLGALPANGTAGVPINQTVVLMFDTPIRPDSVDERSRIEQAGLPIPVKRVVSGNVVELRPTGLFDPSSTYIWRAEGISDLSGNEMSPQASASFSTAAGPDLSSNSIESTTPANGATGVPTDSAVVLRFAKPLHPGLTSPNFITLGPFSQNLPFQWFFSADLKTLTIVPDDPLPPNTNIRLDADSGLFVDLTGTRVEPGIYYDMEFETGN